MLDRESGASARTSAASILLDRAWGKPSQQVDANNRRAAVGPPMISEFASNRRDQTGLPKSGATAADGIFYDIIIHSVGCSGPGTSKIWVAVLDGEELTRHRAPLYAAARALLARGASPMATLRMRHQGSETISMTDVISELAKLTIVEDDGGPRVARWQRRDRLLIAAE
jgi:hypothetical protein